MNDIYIVGAGSLGREVLWIINRINSNEKIWNVKGFIDDANKIYGNFVDGIPIVGNSKYIEDKKEKSYFIVAIADPIIRKNIILKLNKNNKLIQASIIDPSAIIGDRTTIGSGVILYPNSIITIDCKIGNGVVINAGSIIGHGCIIESYTTIAGLVCIGGYVKIGTNTQIGMGANLAPNIDVGDSVNISMGSIVIRGLKDNQKVFGNPAKRILVPGI